MTVTGPHTTHPAGPPAAPVPRADPTAPVPLSHSQVRLWFAERAAHRPGTLNDPVAFRLRGRLDPDRLRAALSAVLHRHEALRTAFPTESAGPVQRVATRVEPDLETVAGPFRDDASLREAVRSEASLGMDLERGSRLRARLFEIGPDDHVLLLVQHHITTDAESTGLLLAELAERYRDDAPAEPLEVQYPDFALWQRERLSGAHLDSLLSYWRRRLDGAPNPALPTDTRPPGRRTSAGALLVHPLPEELSGRVLELARAERMSPFALGLAAFRALMWRSLDQPDLTVGAPMTDRSHPLTRPLIGCFLNLLPLRGRVDPATSLRDLLVAERRGLMGALAHHEAPFDLLVRELSPDRSSGLPFFQTTFSFEQDQALTLDLPGVAGEPFVFEGTAAAFPLMLKVIAGEGGLLCHWGYDDGLYHRSTIADLAERYERVLAALVADPGAPVGSLPDWPAIGAPAAPPEESDDVRDELVWDLDAEEEFTPSTPTEEAVAELWRELLGTVGGAGDGLFDLGGHSLTVARLSLRLEEETGVPVPVADLLVRTTVPEQAALVDELTLRWLSGLDEDTVLAALANTS